MPLRRRLMLLAAPFVGAAALGAIVAFSVPALAASPSPAPSSNPSTTAPGNGGQGNQGNCPNM